jgi:mannosyl-oligosaccharide alpha-1,2-mannosidase
MGKKIRGLSPEIVHFRIPSDGMDEMLNAPLDWYIKGARYVFRSETVHHHLLKLIFSRGEPPPYSARYMLR